jgi:hypothetical protein
VRVKSRASVEKAPSMLFKGLFLIFVLALSFVPVFQATHALTHVDPIPEAHANDGQGLNELGGEINGDEDRVCIDCLALTAFSIIFSALAIFFHNQAKRCNSPQHKHGCILPYSPSPYSTRAPPRG